MCTTTPYRTRVWVTDIRDGGVSAGDFPLLDSLAPFLSAVPFLSLLSLPDSVPILGLLFLAVLLRAYDVHLQNSWTLLFFLSTLLMLLLPSRCSCLCQCFPA